MKARWHMIGAGILLTLIPGAMAVPGVVRFARGRSLRVPAWPVLAAGGVLWLLPATIGFIRIGWDSSGVNEIGQLIGCILAFVGGVALGERVRHRAYLSLGLLMGIAIMAAASGLYWLISPGRVAGWLPHANIWGAAIILPMVAVLLLARSRCQRALSVVLAIFVVAMSGSRAASLALFVTLATFGFVEVFRKMHNWTCRVLSLIGIFVLAAAVYGAMSIVQPRLLSSISDLGSLRALELELPLLGAAQQLGVSISDEGGGTTKVETVAAEWWSRLQYPLILFPQKVYAISVELKAVSAGAQPGLVGVMSGGDIRVVESRGRWSANGYGHVEVIDFDVAKGLDGWVSLRLAFRSKAEKALRLWIGPAASTINGEANESILFRNLQAAVGDSAALLVPAKRETMSHSTNEALARISAFIGGWNGFLKAPLLGQRDEPYPDYYRNNPPTQNTAVPAHSHNILIQTLYEMGLTGFLGLVLLFTWLATILYGRGLVIILTALVANMLDTTLWSSGMMYFLFAFAGLIYMNGTAEGVLRDSKPLVPQFAS